MSKSAASVKVFAGYLLLLGLVLLLSPNSLLRVFRMAATGEVWIRVVGMLVLLLAYYYWNAARTELTGFFRWSVAARTSVPLFFIAFVVAGLAPPTFILFGVIDLAGAIWTALALRGEAGHRAA
ncbi:MAG: hypothetical protein C3F15_01625 [Holophagae bacterium]|nr:MAG: hypothetical protein C3F15_01625 [Holophagae bacterium]